MDTALPISQLDPLGNNHFSGVGNVFEPYLGKLPQLARIDPYEKRNNSNFDLPEEYKGKNLYLRNTIEDHTFTSKQTFMSKYILPIFATDQLHMQWETFEKNAHMLDLAPYQTPGHLVTQKRTVRRASLVRRNIMAEFEQGFLGTPLGRISFLAAIDQFADALQETINQDGMRTLCTGHRYQQTYMRETGLNNDKLIQYILDQDVERFGTVQKTKNGLEKLDMVISKEMAQWGGGADCFLIPEELSIYATIVRPEKTDYNIAGPLGPARVNKLPDGRMVAMDGTMGTLDRAEPMHMLRTAPVFIIKNQMNENVSEAESQQLGRIRQIGEYYLMADTVDDYSDYRSIERSIQLFDMEKNDMVVISLEAAIRNANIWDANGDLKAPMYDDKTRKQDLDEDFLVYLTNEPNRYGSGENRSRYAVRYIFDIAPEFLSAKRVLNGGESLMAAVKREIGTRAFDEDEAAGVAAIRSIIGRDSLLYDGYFGGEVDSDAKIQRFFRNDGTVPVMPEMARPGVDVNSDEMRQARRERDRTVMDFNPVGASAFSQSEIDNGFFQTLMARVPPSKRGEIQSIINSQGSVLERAEQIKGKMLEYVDTSVPDLKWKDRAPVLHWYTERVKQYEAASGPATASVGQKTTSSEVKYMQPGLDLSGSGYKYLYSASADPIRSSLEQFSLFRIANDAARSVRSDTQVRSPVRNEEEGFGLAGIGMFQRENNSLRSAGGRPASGVDFSGLQVHLNGLEAMGATANQKIFALLYLMTRVNMNRMLTFANRNVMIPMNFLLLRPHMQFLTRGIIKCAMNGGTGLTFMGNSNLQMSWETGRKMALMHYTTHFRSVIIYPKNLYVQPDVYVQAYEGGANTRFYNEETYRLSNLDDLKNSLICAPIPIEETNFPRHLNITGRHYGSYSSGLASRAEFERLHYSTAARMNQIFRFNDASRQGSDEPMLTVNRHHWNLICQQGHQQNYNKKSNAYDQIIGTKGHLKHVYPGVAHIWNGALEVLREN